MIFLLLSFSLSYESNKKCSDMRFCSNNLNAVGQWSLQEPYFNKVKNEFTANLYNNGIDDNLRLVIYLMQNNTFRITFHPTNIESYNRYKVFHNEFVINQDTLHQHLPLNHKVESNIHYLQSNDCNAEISLSPFTITITDKFNSKVFLNTNQNLVFEHHGEPVPPDPWPYYHDDLLKNGATAVSIDCAFKGKNTRITGFAEADEPLNVPDTESEPKRLLNLDYFSNYGHIPLFYGHSSTEMAAIFWLNPSDTFLKITTDAAKDTRNVRIISEGGYADLFVFTGEISTILSSYTNLTGHHEVPPIFALGYHQSKWAYENQRNVETLLDTFDEYKIPLDVMWLDVDHLHNHGPFRFNRTAFPNPAQLFKKLADKGRYLVRLNDPHLDDDDTHTVFKFAKDQRFFVKKADGITQYRGDCWPGPSYWPDFLNPDVRDWWSSLYAYQESETAPNVFFWNDMNEPAVFNEVEGTFPTDLLYYDNYEHREIRNIYGLMMHSATYQGVVNRNEDKNTRPFILTRSFFAGSQKFAWQWSGDNTAKWEHLGRSISMSLVAGLCGMPMAGADIGGFFNHPTEQLLFRWYQVADFAYPLYRSHCNLESPHREPYLYNEPTRNLIVDAIKQRYYFIPHWYTSIQTSHDTGLPPVLPLFALFPSNDELHDVEDQFILGESLMVAPVIEENAIDRHIIKPPGIWYDLYTSKRLESSVTIDVQNESLPAYVRGGYIIPKFSSIGMTVKETRKNPLSLIVACDENGNAKGPLYIDDGLTYNYSRGEYLNIWITYKNNSITLEKRGNSSSIPEIAKNAYIDHIIFYGAKGIPEPIKNAKVVCNDGQCIMSDFKLFVKDVQDSEDDDEDDDDDQKSEFDKEKKYFIIGGVCLGVIVIIIVVVVVILCKRKKGKSKENTEIVEVLDPNNGVEQL